MKYGHAILFSGICAIFTIQCYANSGHLSSQQEHEVIQTLKSHVCDDGATVSQVLTYAQKITKNQFKVRDYTVGYDHENHVFACVDFNESPNMGKDDVYTSCWKVSGDLKSVSPTNEDSQALANMTQAGQDIFATYVNDSLMVNQGKYNEEFIQNNPVLNKLPAYSGVPGSDNTVLKMLQGYGAKINTVTAWINTSEDVKNNNSLALGTVIETAFDINLKKCEPFDCDRIKDFVNDNGMFTDAVIKWFKPKDAKDFKFLSCSAPDVICEQVDPAKSS